MISLNFHMYDQLGHYLYMPSTFQYVGVNACRVEKSTPSVPLSLSLENRAPLTIPVPERQTQWDGGSTLHALYYNEFYSAALAS